MASNTTPYTSYRTDRIQLIGNPEQRSGTTSGQFNKDQRFINFYPTLVDSPLNGSKRYRLEQRPALTLDTSNSPVSGQESRGIYYYEGSIYTVYGNTLYKNATAIQVIAAPLSDRSRAVGFIEYANITNKYLIVLDGTSGWTVTPAGVVAQIVDVDFPTPHSVQGAYMDGYLFVAKSNSDDIYNCVLNDPFTWNAGDFISAEMYPDYISGLTRQNNYIVAIGAKSMEYFYDAGTTPGTPLARNPAAAHQIGTVAPASIVQSEEQIIFVGQTGVGGFTIWVMDGFQPTEIGIDPVKKAINNEGNSISSTNAFCVRVGGHRFYVLTLPTLLSNNDVSTWVYDFDTKMWHQWASGTNGDQSFACQYASEYFLTGEPAMQGRFTGIYRFQYGVAVDTDGPIASTAISAKLDFGNLNRKFMSRFSLVCDVPVRPGGVSTLNTYSLSWSDDDYQTWSTPRTIDISDTMMPSTTQLGSFRRRAFKIIYKANTSTNAMLLEGFEVDTNMGSQ